MVVLIIMVFIIHYYIEFLMANLELQNALTEEKLKEAFNFFDKNGDGVISIDELREAFGAITSENVLNKMISEVDTDKDGAITFRDFINMMTTYKENLSSNIKISNNLK